MPDVEKKPRSSRRMRVVLILSLTFNLLVIGIVAGAVLGGGHRRPPVGDVSFGPYTEALSRDDRAALRDAFFDQEPGFREARARMETDFAALLTALRADPYDAAAVERLVAVQQQRAAERLELGRTLLVERIGAMDPEARNAFADRLEEAVRNPRKSRGRRGEE